MESLVVACWIFSCDMQDLLVAACGIFLVACRILHHVGPLHWDLCVMWDLYLWHLGSFQLRHVDLLVVAFEIF